jgi:YegS/Rv2252/BmrU family lipid kinase
MNKTIHFIINPISGGKRKKNIPELIEQHISKEWDVEIHYTRHAGHGKIIASYLANEGAYMIVAVGGDGSMNEIGSSLMNKETLFGIIPTGSGNGFAHHFNIPENIAKALKIIDTGHFVLSDIGKMEGHYFLSNIGIGLDAVIAKEFEAYHSRGFLSYIKIAVREYFKFKPMNTSIEVDGIQEEVENALLISVANTSEFGNKFQIAPDNKHDDGLLELVIFQKPPLLILPFTVLRFFNKSIRKSAYVSHQLVKKITLTGFDFIQKDGDWIDEKLEAPEIKIIPKCLKIVTQNYS